MFLVSFMTSLGNMQPSQQMWRNFFVGLPYVVTHPVTGVMGDLEFALRVVGQTMPACLVVRARTFHGRVVLGDVEIDRPGTQGRRQCSPERRRVWPASLQFQFSGRMRSSGAL